MSQPTARQTLQQRALKAMLTEAFFDWKSAVIIALTLLLAALLSDNGIAGFGLSGWHWWYFVAGGGAAWAALFASMLSDPAFRANAVAEMLRQDYNPARLHNRESSARVNKALEYRQRITEAAARAREGMLRDHLQETAHQIDDWINSLYNLALRLDTYESDDVIRTDLLAAPKAIETLRARLRQEDDEAVRQQITQTIQAKEAQLASLRNLANTMEKAELQMETTTSALGTVYSQLLLFGAKDIDSGRAQRLREDIKSQVDQLHDLVESVDEVYAQRT